MRFTIQNLERTTVQTKYGMKNKFRFTSNGQQFDAWEKRGFTDQFAPGYSFEADLSGKPYKGVDTILWPKADRYQVQKDGTLTNLDNNAQLDRIERKLDFLLKTSGFTDPKIMSNKERESMGLAELPYADSPPPSDEDAPF